MSETWVPCKERLPRETNHHSKTVKVLLDNRKEGEDFTIDGKWVWHCMSDKIGGYPIAWRD